MAKLQIADNLALPLDAVTRRMAILAMSGAGKSNLAVVLAEQMFDAGLPWVAIDPKGDWWGIRSSRDGRGPGLSIPIFGGLHHDVDIQPTAAAGAELAEAIVAQRLTCVVDVSEFTDRQAMWGFLAAFGETLLRRNREALHLFLEEADEYLPQRTSEKGNLPRCLGVWQRVVKRGRFRGIGSTQITQRNAALNKDTLYMAEALFAMRATGKGDRDAVKGWVEYHNAAEEIVASLPTLADGEGWLTSPAWLRKTTRVQFAQRRTFDSGSTPVLLRGRSKSVTLADVNLSALRAQMAAAIEQAEAHDPKKLQAKLQAAQAELAKKEKLLAAIDERTQRIDAKLARVKPVPALTDADRELLTALRDEWLIFTESIAEKADAMLTSLAERAKAELDRAAGAWIDNIDKRRALFTARLEKTGVQRVLGKIAALSTAPPPAVTIHASPSAKPETRQALHQVARALIQRPPRAPLSDGERDPRLHTPAGELKKHVRGILTALAQHQDGRTREQTLILAAYQPSGDISTAFAAMLERGWVVSTGAKLQITFTGLEALGDFEPLPTGEKLRDLLLAKGTSAERKMLGALFECNRAPASRAYLHELAGLKPSGDTSTALAKFLKLGWAEERDGGIVASDTFFEEAMR